MGYTTTSFIGFRSITILVALILMLTCGMGSVVYAQTPGDVQYDKPTASGEAAIKASDAKLKESVGVSGMLPATGGPLLALVALGAAALGSTSLLAIRYSKRRR